MDSLKQLDSLIGAIDEVLSGSSISLHESMLEEIRQALARIQRQVNEAAQAELIQSLIQKMDEQQQIVLSMLEIPLRSLFRLTQDERLPDHQKARLLIQIGKSHDILAQWDVAQDCFLKALDYCQQNSVERAEALMRLGHIKSKRQKYKEAEELYRKSIQLYSRLARQDMVVNIQICMGHNAFERSRYDEAQSWYEEALRTAIPNGLEEGIAQAHLALGVLATAMGEFEKALEHYDFCLASYEKLGDQHGLAATYHNLGMLQVDMGKWAQAGESYQRCLEYAERVGDIELIGLVNLNRTATL